MGDIELEGDDLAIVVLNAADTLAVFERIPWFPRRVVVCLALPFDLQGRTSVYCSPEMRVSDLRSIRSLSS